MDAIRQLLNRGVAEVIVKEEVEALLRSNRKLRLKQGFDPSRPDIHLGHVVGLRKLRQFQELGHQVILIVGDWTAQIGDPSGMSVTRPMLTAEEVRYNAATYIEQFFKVVDKEKTEIVWQSEWFGKFNLADIIKLTSKFTVAQFLAREDFNNRFKAGRPIAITELLYPLLQAYDSVAIKADIEFGGVDQKFNCLVGRELQGMVGLKPQQVFLVPLLVGTDGVQKMSKSLGNYVGITEPPHEMFGKIMSIPDNLILDYLELLTDVPQKELDEIRDELNSQSINPMLIKKRLAREIVEQFHNIEQADEADRYFTRVFQKKDLPDNLMTIHYIVIQSPCAGTVKVLFSKSADKDLDSSGMLGEVEATVDIHNSSLVKCNTVDVLDMLGVVKSKSEAKRMLAQGAVDIDNVKITTDNITLRNNSVIKVGKRKFIKLIENQ